MKSKNPLILEVYNNTIVIVQIDVVAKNIPYQTISFNKISDIFSTPKDIKFNIKFCFSTFFILFLNISLYFSKYQKTIENHPVQTK
jgi:hypothetical protein